MFLFSRGIERDQCHEMSQSNICSATALHETKLLTVNVLLRFDSVFNSVI